MTKVDKLACEAMMWMNSSMNQQNKLTLSVDPAIKIKDIQAKTKVSILIKTIIAMAFFNCLEQ